MYKWFLNVLINFVVSSIDGNLCMKSGFSPRFESGHMDNILYNYIVLGASELNLLVFDTKYSSVFTNFTSFAFLCYYITSPTMLKYQ